MDRWTGGPFARKAAVPCQYKTARLAGGRASERRDGERQAGPGERQPALCGQRVDYIERYSFLAIKPQRVDSNLDYRLQIDGCLS